MTLATTSPDRKVFFGALESLRGIAAMLVIIYHLPPWFEPVYRIQLFRHGYLMVNFFFVLSGFVLWHSYGGRIRDNQGLIKFCSLRLGRLYPVHIVFVLPFLFIEVAKYLASSKYGVATAGAPTSLTMIWETLLANLLLVQGLGVNTGLAFNFPNWSISTEFYTYLIFGCGTLLLKRRAFLGASLAIVVASVIAVVVFGQRLGEFSNIFRCVGGFFLGCLTRAAFEPVRHRTLRFDWALVVAGLSLLALALPWKPAFWGASWYEQLSLPSASLLILALLLSPTSVVNAFLLSAPLRWLGEISYSLYMSHALIQWLARQACRVILKKREVIINGIGAAPLTLREALVVYPAVLIVTLCAGWLCYRFIEAPLRDAARQRISARFERKPLAST